MCNYGPSGLRPGALLAGKPLLMILQSGKNYHYIDLTVRELSNIIEMTLIAGLYLLTGTS
jgi:hypothetical protein